MNDNMNVDDEALDAMLGISDAREIAEQGVLHLLRGEDAPAFTLSISCRGSQWTVQIDEPDGAGPGTGEGGTFAEAWHRIDPWWAKGGNDNG